MTVEFVPNNESCFLMGLSNEVWFVILKETQVGNVLGRQYTNDEIIATKEQAIQCAEILANWQPPAEWCVLPPCCFSNKEKIEQLIRFFHQCGGFKTH